MPVMVKLLVLVMTMWMVTPAHAADDAAFEKAWTAAETAANPAELDAFAKLDNAFGTFAVKPLSAVMFFDVLFWDNKLELGRGLGTFEVPAPEKLSPQNVYVNAVTTFEAGKGYGRQHVIRHAGDTLRPILVEPTTKRIGPINVNLQTERTTGEPVVMARIPVQNANLAALGVNPWDPEGPENPVQQVMVPELGFMVKVDRRTLKLEPASGPAPASAVPIAAEGRVYDSAKGQEYTVLGGTAGAWQLLDDERSWSHDALPNPKQVGLPIVVLWLVLGAVFFTFRMMFINIRGFFHAIAVVLGRYDSDHEEGEISHFQALSSALSATVGLGNIAGVAIAISLGGPGAVFWLWVAGFLGMSSKFTECTLGQMYRERAPDGTVSGGPMYYLDKGLAEMGLGPLGKGLAILFALMCIGGSLGGGNMFQANQSFEAIASIGMGFDMGNGFIAFADYPWLYGIFLMIMVGFVIMGGIKRIGAAAGVVVPVMCGIYVLAGAYVLLVHAAEVPAAFGSIISQAFSPTAGYGGMVGVLVTGFQRASFSNEAGVGSASIAHSAAATDEPVREGIVALLEPFIDTLVVCTVTALVVVVTKAEVPPGSGISATMAAFETIIPWFPVVLAFAAMLFAFSTMVSWSYYGERAAVWLFGENIVIPYRILFLVCVFLGSVVKLGNVLGFSDLMILGMAFPNILGAVILSGKVKTALDEYMGKLRTGDWTKAES